MVDFVLVRDVLALMSLIVGLFFMLVGAIGVVRMPDVYHRIHAATKCTTLGLSGLLLAAVLHLDDMTIIARALLIVLFIAISNPVGAHMLAKAALLVKAPQWEGTLDDEHQTAQRRKAESDGSSDGKNSTPPSNRKHR